MSKPIVLYHEKCPDGFGAAFAAWLVLGTSADYVPVGHGDPMPDCTGRAVWMADYSLARPGMDQLAGEASRLVLLDHHKTAADNLAGWRYDPAKVSVTLDMHRSGARLAWDHFHPGKEPPWLIRHVEDRDLWRWALADSQAYLAHLDTLPRNFETWQELARHTPEAYGRFVAEGAAMHRKFMALVGAYAESAMPVRLGTETGWMANAGPMFASDVGALLARRGGTFGLVWRVDGAGAVRVSLRSSAPYTVDGLAARFGGGGHAQAAAFKLPAARLPELLSGALGV